MEKRQNGSRDEQEQDVQQRVCQRRDDGGGVAAAGDRQDRANQRSGDRANSQAADDAVQPQTQRQSVGDLADDKQQGDEREGIERQPQRVGR